MIGCNISNVDVSLLGVLENQIDRNLRAIRDQHLYRGTAETFEEWLDRRFALQPIPPQPEKGGPQ